MIRSDDQEKRSAPIAFSRGYQSPKKGPLSVGKGDQQLKSREDIWREKSTHDSQSPRSKELTLSNCDAPENARKTS